MCQDDHGLCIHGMGSGKRVGVVFPTLRGGAEGGGSAQPQRGGRVGAVLDYKSFVIIFLTPTSKLF